jgi:hypothetical protein
MQEGIESIGGFVVSGCDTSKLLEAIEESIDEVSCLVAMTAPVGMDSIKASPGVTSAAWPAVRIRRTELPRASTQA